MSEFKIIAEHFQKSYPQQCGVLLGSGDDAAIVRVPDGFDLAVSTDTLVAGVHFPLPTKGYDLGYKALAVNISDMAAMGADPKWVSVGLTVPKQNTLDLAELARGFFELADSFQVALIGGDLTRGPLCLTATIQGLLPKNQGHKRTGANVGDLIWVSGDLGGAALALKEAIPAPHKNAITTKLHHPQPRVALGKGLLGLASSCIDISDGLVQDLNHVLKGSGVGATLTLDKLPLHEALTLLLPRTAALNLALSGGDDYELLFSAPATNSAAILALAQADCPLTCIGEITAEKTLTLIDNQQPFHLESSGWDHFHNN